jgi:transcriptional regulator with XRE-family HTH domain
MDDIILKIKQLVKLKKITYQEFADELDISRQTVNNWFKGRSNISIPHLKKIASYFGVPVSYFFDETPSGVSNVVNNGHNSNVIAGSNIQITLAKKESEIELLKAKLEACHREIESREKEFKSIIESKEKEIATLRELIDVLKEKCN